MHTELCLCAEIPRVSVDSEFLIIQHNRERTKPTNSARLIPMVMPRARIHYYAVRGEPFDPTPLQSPDCDYVLLFPGPEASVLTPPGEPCDPPVPASQGVTPPHAEDNGRRRVIVMLDGSWGQCSRMSHRVPGLAEMSQVALPPGPPGRWGVRSTNDPARLCSFEAAIRVVEILHGAPPARDMQIFFDRLTARMLFMKAKLRSPRVPAEWNSPAGADS